MQAIAASPAKIKSKQNLIAVLVAGLLLTQSGCVALNIPSQRLHDPDDQGGLFGHWKDAKHRQPDLVASFPGIDPESVQHAASTAQAAAGVPDHSHHAGSHADSPCVDGSCFDCEADLYDPLMGTEPAAEVPEIPWPKYHPVPTRPVFAPHGVH